MDTVQGGSYFIGALAAFVTATVGAIIAWRKVRPETASIHVTSANNLVEVAIRATGLVEEQRDDLVAEIGAIRDRMAALESRAQAAEDRALAAERRVTLLEDDIERIRESKMRVAEQNLLLKERVKHLEDEVERLRGLLGGNMIVPDPDAEVSVAEKPETDH